MGQLTTLPQAQGTLLSAINVAGNLLQAPQGPLPHGAHCRCQDPMTLIRHMKEMQVTDALLALRNMGFGTGELVQQVMTGKTGLRPFDEFGDRFATEIPLPPHPHAERMSNSTSPSIGNVEVGLKKTLRYPAGTYTLPYSRYSLTAQTVSDIPDKNWDATLASGDPHMTALRRTVFEEDVIVGLRPHEAAIVTFSPSFMNMDLGNIPYAAALKVGGELLTVGQGDQDYIVSPRPQSLLTLPSTAWDKLMAAGAEKVGLQILVFGMKPQKFLEAMREKLTELAVKLHVPLDAMLAEYLEQTRQAEGSFADFPSNLFDRGDLEDTVVSDTPTVLSDPFGRDAWNFNEPGKFTVYPVGPELWKQLAGWDLPASKFTEAHFQRAHIPWPV